MAKRKQPMNKTMKAAWIIAVAILGSTVLDNIIWKVIEGDTTCVSSVSYHQAQYVPVQQVSQHDQLIQSGLFQHRQSQDLGIYVSF